MIPKIIHQIWVGPNSIPEKSIRFINRIKELHPSFEYRLWTDNDITPDNFVNYHIIQMAQAYAQKADIMRYEILYRYGGIYLDIDMEVLKPLDELLMNDLIVCNEDANIDKLMSIGFIAAVPHNKNMLNSVQMIHTVVDRINKDNLALTTGPHYFRKCITLDNTVTVLPTHTFYPTHYLQKGFIPSVFREDTYAMHHWDKNW